MTNYFENFMTNHTLKGYTSLKNRLEGIDADVDDTDIGTIDYPVTETNVI